MCNFQHRPIRWTTNRSRSKVVASQAAASNLNIGFTVGGTATTADYELSAQSFLLEAGKTEATVTVTPKQAYKEAKTLTFNLAAGKGYVIGGSLPRR